MRTRFFCCTTLIVAVLGKARFATTQRDTQRKLKPNEYVSWESTVSAKAQHAHVEQRHAKFIAAKSFVTQNGDVAHVGDHVVYTKKADMTVSTPSHARSTELTHFVGLDWPRRRDTRAAKLKHGAVRGGTEAGLSGSIPCEASSPSHATDDGSRGRKARCKLRFTYSPNQTHPIIRK